MLEAAEVAREELIHVLADMTTSSRSSGWKPKRPATSEPGADQGSRPTRSDRNRITAVICGSSFKNKGVQPMLDAVIDYLPSPLEIRRSRLQARSPRDRHREAHVERRPLAMLAFKIAADPHLGKLTYIRVYSGVLKAGQAVLNSTKGRKERIGKIYQMHANKRQEIDQIGAGEIIAVMGLKDTTTGETSAIRRTRSCWSPWTSRTGDRAGHRAKTKSDQEKLGVAIQRLAEEDPTFRVHTDEETGRPSSPAWASCTSK